MLQRACALLAANHMEVFLQPVEIGEKYDTRLVEMSRRLEDVPGQRNGRRKQFAKPGFVAGREPAQRDPGVRCDRSEGAEHRVGGTARVAGDQFRIVELATRARA